MYIDEPLRKYLDETASGSPTPGGGSVAALVGALGAALTSMVCNFTVGKKKYKEVESEVNEILSQAETIRANLLDLSVEDIRVYRQVSAAYSLPKRTDHERQVRSDAIQTALKAAMEVPLKAAVCCYQVLELNKPLLEKGNRNLISDVGVAAILAEAALRASIVNVEINLSYIKDQEFSRKARERLSPLIKKANELNQEICKEVSRTIQAKLM